jgi:hypothetical protein
VFIEERAMQPFDEAITLRASDPCGAVFDVFELQEELVGMSVRPAAIFPAVVAEDRRYSGTVFFEEGQDVLVEQMNGRHRELVMVEPAPGITGMAINRGLKIDFADALEGPDKEGVDGDQIAGVAGLDVPLSELWAESLQETYLVFGEGEFPLADRLLKAQESLMLGHQVMSVPNATDTARANLNTIEDQLLGHSQASLGGALEAVIQNGPLHGFAHPVGMRTLGSGQSVDKPIGAEGLVISPDFVELLP